MSMDSSHTVLLFRTVCYFELAYSSPLLSGVCLQFQLPTVSCVPERGILLLKYCQTPVVASRCHSARIIHLTSSPQIRILSSHIILTRRVSPVQ